MMGVRLPLRLVIGKLLLDGVPRTAKDICVALQAQYAGERQINSANLEAQLLALKGVGIVAGCNESETETAYRITPDGKQRVLRNL